MQLSYLIPFFLIRDTNPTVFTSKMEDFNKNEYGS